MAGYSYTIGALPANENVARMDYGDWQTDYGFAKSVCLYLKSRGVAPDAIVEPTCGVGNFIAAAIDVFPTVKKCMELKSQKNIF